MAEPVVRIHIRVRGRVQGVGFRAFVAQCAHMLGVTGWVRNVGWDTVETVSDGSRSQIEQFAEYVRMGPSHSRVEEFYPEEEPAVGQFDGFEIRSSL